MHYDNSTPQLYYRDYHGHVSNEMLDNKYSKYGRTFKEKGEADLFKIVNPRSIVTRLISYCPQQLERDGHVIRPRAGSKPFTTGWLVTLAASWKNDYKHL